MVTQVVNASVSFTFFGSGLQLYGAERPTHGLYQVTIDSRTYSPANGDVSAGREVFQAPLFQTAALKTGFHKLTVVNLGNSEFDLDFLSWQTPIGEEQETLLSFTFQDSDSSFQYTPASAWSTNPPNIGTFNGGSGQPLEHMLNTNLQVPWLRFLVQWAHRALRTLFNWIMVLRRTIPLQAQFIINKQCFFKLQILVTVPILSD